MAVITAIEVTGEDESGNGGSITVESVGDLTQNTMRVAVTLTNTATPANVEQIIFNVQAEDLIELGRKVTLLLA